VSEIHHVKLDCGSEQQEKKRGSESLSDQDIVGHEI
jgi:hypothetical protein